VDKPVSLTGQCQTGETCQSLRGCQELAGILLEAKQTGDELRKQEIVQFLRSRVCSKEDRAVCCASQGQRQSGEIEGDIQKFIACNWLECRTYKDANTKII